MSDSKEKFTLINSETTRLEIDVSKEERFVEYKNFHTDKDISRLVFLNLARRDLPYGIWTCADGREVVFNREYQPILQRKDGVNSYADRSEWVKNITGVKYLYNDSNTPFDYLTKNLRNTYHTAKSMKECKKSLFICIKVIQEYSPKEGVSVNRNYSLLEC